VFQVATWDKKLDKSSTKIQSPQRKTLRNNSNPGFFIEFMSATEVGYAKDFFHNCFKNYKKSKTT
jgi:hypothetical protein